MTMAKNLSDNVMSSLGLAYRGGETRKVDPLAAVNKVRDSKKNLKTQAYKAALLDLLYLQAVTGQIPGVTQNPNQPLMGGLPPNMPMPPGMAAQMVPQAPAMAGMGGPAPMPPMGMEALMGAGGGGMM